MQAPSDVVREHWPEYLMEAAGLGLFMISAAVVTTLFEYPHSPVYAALPDPLVRRVCIGIAMGLTAIGVIYSPWGKRSGAHLNPAVTIGLLCAQKIDFINAIGYVIAQCLGVRCRVTVQYACSMRIAFWRTTRHDSGFISVSP